MKKFSEIEYVRPDMEAEQEKVRAYTKALKEAKSYEELRGLFMEEKTREDAWTTMAEVAQVDIRWTPEIRFMKERFSSGMRRFRRSIC